MDFQTIMQNFLVTLVTGILGVLAAFLIGLVKKGFAWIDAKINNVKNETAKTEFFRASSILQDTVSNVVTSLQQTIGDEIKKSLANNDGKYTRDDLLNLKNVAFMEITNQLSSGVMEILNGVYDDVDDVINSMIETKVHELKDGLCTLSTKTLLVE